MAVSFSLSSHSRFALSGSRESDELFFTLRSMKYSPVTLATSSEVARYTSVSAPSATERWNGRDRKRPNDKSADPSCPKCELTKPGWQQLTVNFFSRAASSRVKRMLHSFDCAYAGRPIGQ